MSTGQTAGPHLRTLPEEFLAFCWDRLAGSGCTTCSFQLLCGLRVECGFAIQRQQPWRPPRQSWPGWDSPCLSAISSCWRDCNLARATVKAVAAVPSGATDFRPRCLQSSLGSAAEFAGQPVWLILLWMALWMFLAVVVMMAIIIPDLPAAQKQGVSRRRVRQPRCLPGLVAFAVTLLVFAGFIAIYVRYALAISKLAWSRTLGTLAR